MDRTKAIIRKVGNEFCVFSHGGKNLGCSTDRKGAEKRLRQVEYFKHKGSSEMNYDKAFSNFAKALSEVNPIEVGKASTATSPTLEINSELNVSDNLAIGSIASRASSRVLDNKDHFPVITETQARSSMARVLQLTETPAWYSGTIAELRQEVYAGIVILHPDIELNVRVPVELAVALSDGQTPCHVSEKTIKNPADVAKNQVPSVSRRTLTSAQVAEALKNDDLRSAIAGRLMEIVDQHVEQLKTAKKVATQLLNSGLTSEEFDQLSTFLQEGILREIIGRGATASRAEDRRLELINKLK